MAKARTVKLGDLESRMVIIDPDGNRATVSRVHRINHEKARLTTDLGVHIGLLDEPVRLAE